MNLQHNVFRSITPCLVAVMVLSMPVFAQSNERDVLRDRIEWLSSTSDPTVDGAPIAAVLLITKLYERRGYEPAWTDPAMIEELFDQVLRSVEHGLNPEDFHVGQLGARLNPGTRANDPVFRADTEILCTDALARLGVTLKFGKLNPADLDTAWNFSRKIEAEDPVKVFNDVLDEKNIAAALEETGPNLRFYSWLRQALVTYRGIMAAGRRRLAHGARWRGTQSGVLRTAGRRAPRAARNHGRSDGTRSGRPRGLR